jgi:hypothetical protein
VAAGIALLLPLAGYAPAVARGSGSA